jgi:hypothetical protein
MSFTQQDLNTLNTAIVGAELEVEYNGRRVKFRSVAELREAYAHVKGELAQQQATTSGQHGPWRFRFTSQRGE